MFELILYIYAMAIKYDVKPEVAYAIAQVESRLDHTKVGSKGEIGLYQLLPSSFPQYTKQELKNKKRNIEIAIKYLSQISQRCKHKKDNSWVVCYNYGIRGGSALVSPKNTSYYKKFIVEYKKINKSYAN